MLRLFLCRWLAPMSPAHRGVRARGKAGGGETTSLIYSPSNSSLACSPGLFLHPGVAVHLEQKLNSFCHFPVTNNTSFLCRLRDTGHRKLASFSSVVWAKPQGHSLGSAPPAATDSCLLSDSFGRGLFQASQMIGVSFKLCSSSPGGQYVLPAVVTP